VQKDEEKKIIVDNLVNQPQEVLQGQSIWQSGNFFMVAEIHYHFRRYIILW
jgi:hypothetical protein